MRLALPLQIGLSLFALGGAWIDGHASPPTEVTFHCPSACKIYIDGQLVASLAGDGIRVVKLANTKSYTVLITRTGKSTWSYSITPIEPLLIDPDETTPHTIDGPTKPQSHTEVTKAPAPTTNPVIAAQNTPAPASTPSQYQYPSWLLGAWGKELESKKFRLSAGSVSCPATSSAFSYVIIDPNQRAQPRVIYHQLIQLDDVSKSAACEDLQDDRMTSNDWFFNIDAPIRLEAVSEDSASFVADLSKCKKCQMPESLHDVTGHIYRAPAGIRLVWEGQLSGAGEVALSKR